MYYTCKTVVINTALQKQQAWTKSMTDMSQQSTNKYSDWYIVFKDIKMTPV
jgi:hypothetical protein